MYFKMSRRNRFDSLYAILILLFLIGPSINFYINFFVQSVLKMNLSVSIIFYFLMSVGGVFCLINSFYKNGCYLFVYLSLFIVVCLSGIFYSTISKNVFVDLLNPVYSRPYVLFVYCIPLMFFMIEHFRNTEEKIKKYIWPFLFVNLLLGLLNYFFVIKDGLTMQYMTFSYNLLMPTVGSFVYLVFYKKARFRILFAIFGLLGVLCILFSGARGALISLILSLISIVFFHGKITIEKALFLLVFLVTLITFIIFFNSIINGLIDISEQLGINQTRTLTKILDNSLLSDDGRLWRYDMVFKGILNNPFGYGVYGDWICCDKYGGTATYVHCLPIELMADFGIIFGPLFFVLLCFNLFRTLKSKQSYLMFVLVPVSFFQLLFSGSFMWEVSFFAMIGLFIASYSKKENENSNYKYPMLFREHRQNLKKHT